MVDDIFGCNQAALLMIQSLGPSVRLSVRLSVTPSSLCFLQRIIMKFSGFITIDMSDIHAKGHAQKSKVKVTEVETNFAPIWAFPDHNSLASHMAWGHMGQISLILTRIGRFQTVTPVWINKWLRNDAQRLTGVAKRGAPLYV